MEVVQRVHRLLRTDKDFGAPNIDERFHQAIVPRSVDLARSIASKSFWKALLQSLVPSAKLRRYPIEFFPGRNLDHWSN